MSTENQRDPDDISGLPQPKPHTSDRIVETFRKCSICDDLEAFHAHKGEERIEDYFTVGRCSSDLVAAQVWRERALAAEKRLAQIKS